VRLARCPPTTLSLLITERDKLNRAVVGSPNVSERVPKKERGIDRYHTGVCVDRTCQGVSRIHLVVGFFAFEVLHAVIKQFSDPNPASKGDFLIVYDFGFLRAPNF
jgi:hypothetical protein